MTAALVSAVLWVAILPFSMLWWVVKGVVRAVLGMVLIVAIIVGVIYVSGDTCVLDPDQITDRVSGAE